MSQAFVKDEDEQWLHDIPPTEAALMNYLIRSNNGVRVNIKRRYLLPDGKEALEMSNGFSYARDDNSKWYMI